MEREIWAFLLRHEWKKIQFSVVHREIYVLQKKVIPTFI